MVLVIWPRFGWENLFSQQLMKGGLLPGVLKLQPPSQHSSHEHLLLLAHASGQTHDNLQIGQAGYDSALITTNSPFVSSRENQMGQTSTERCRAQVHYAAPEAQGCVHRPCPKTECRLGRPNYTLTLLMHHAYSCSGSHRHPALLGFP